ncbi:hypothetical protein [Sutcliffiella halmapala]|uniref:hypothetical protein n=1 Tax=Sutcliffiella halmapala TaxID=79882 RepID=UPI0009951DC1|nr:hypothetical protein [Sutcliffiella halmapala]
MLKNLIVFSLVFILLVGTFSGVATASEITEEEKLIEEVAEQLEFLFETAVIKDAYGNKIGVDFEMFEEKYGSSPELDILKGDKDNFLSFIQYFDSEPEEYIETPMFGSQLMVRSSAQKKKPWVRGQNPALDKCIQDKIVKEYKQYFSITALTTVMQLMSEGKYTDAAKRLLRIGVKGNVLGVVATLMYFWGACAWETSPK